MAVDNQSRVTVLATISGSSFAGGTAVDISGEGLFLSSGDYADITTNQEEITIVRKFDDSSLVHGVLTASEAWDAWTLPNSSASGSSMYSVSGNFITFSTTSSDYSFVRTAGTENLPVISASDTVYIVRSTVKNNQMVTFQPASRITSVNLNTSIQQLFYLIQEIDDRFHNFDKLSPFFGMPNGIATLDSTGTIKEAQMIGAVINYSDSLAKWDAEAKKIGNMLTPVDEADAVTKDYVDNAMNYTTPSGTPLTGSILVTSGTAGTGQDYTLPFTALSTNVSTWMVHHNTTFLKPTTDFTIHATNNTINIIGTTVDTDVISVQNIGAEVYPAPPSTPQAGVVTITSITAGTDQTYTLPFTPASTTTNSYNVAINGVAQIPFTDFTVDATGITILGATLDEDVISVQNMGISKSTLSEDPGIIGDLTVSGSITGTVTATGSTSARTLASRFADTVNVKDWGATGDGTTDDTVAIQAALDKGGKVYIPEGTYRISAILTMGSGTSLSGEGDNSILKPLDSSGDAVSPVLLIKNKTNVRVSSLKIDGNATNLTQAAGHSAIYISASSYCTIDSVHIIDCGRESGANSAGAHIMLNAYESGDSSAGDNDHAGVSSIGNTIKNCILEDPDGKCKFGIRLFTNWDYEIEEDAFVITCSHNNIDRNTLSGFSWNNVEIAGPGTIYNNISNNIIKDCKGYSAIESDKGASYNVFDSNIATGFLAATDGSKVILGMRCQGGLSPLGKLRRGRYNVFSNNIISDLNTASTTSTCFGFSKTADCSLVGNVFRGSISTGVAYGVHLYDNNSSLLISNNAITDVTTGIINDPTGVESTTKNITIQSNTIEATLDGINFTNDDSGSYLYEVYILNNILKDGMTNVGINAGTDVDNSIVRGNIIGSCISASGLTGDGIRTNGDNNIIDSNQISDYNRSGINVQSSATGTVVRDNYTSSVTGTAVGILTDGVINIDGTTAGSGSAGSGKQSVQININGTTYKVLHDGTV